MAYYESTNHIYKCFERSKIVLTTGRLVKTNEVSIFKPIRDIVRVILEMSESKYFEN